MKKENIKICMSVIAKTDDEIKASMQQAKDADVNMVEWRVDYYEHAQDIEKVINMLKCIRSIIEDKELIFTYRSKHEGGENSLTTPEYLLLAKTAILTKLIDYIDVEFLLGDSVVNNIVKHAKIVNTKVLMSNHDWNSTPRKEIIENRLQAMLDRGADIAKVVCMPRCEEDVETLIQAGQAISKKHDNVILISLGELGKQTMTQPELTGSCIQFIEK